MVRTGDEAIEYARSRVGPDAMPASGYCLQFVRECFGVGSYYGSAIDAWNGAQYPHPGDRNPPPAVPLYFTSPSIYDHVVFGGGPPANEIMTTFNDDVRQYSGEDAISAIERDFEGTYLGWCEDINTVRVWSPGDDGGDLDMDEGTVRSIVQQETTKSLRSEGVSGAADGSQPWAQTTMRQVVQEEATKTLRAEGVSGAADGNQQWAQVYVRNIVREEIDKSAGSSRAGVTWQVVLALLLAVAIVIGLVLFVAFDVQDGIVGASAALLGGIVAWVATTLHGGKP
jgi:hypothetical protein